MSTFQVGETVICSITVKDASDNLQNPATSTNIEVYRTVNNASLQSSTSMDNDGTGLYHKDIATSSGERGEYTVKYTATDGTRITIVEDSFTLE